MIKKIKGRASKVCFLSQKVSDKIRRYFLRKVKNVAENAFFLPLPKKRHMRKKNNFARKKTYCPYINFRSFIRKSQKVKNVMCVRKRILPEIRHIASKNNSEQLLRVFFLHKQRIGHLNFVSCLKKLVTRSGVIFRVKSKMRRKMRFSSPSPKNSTLLHPTPPYSTLVAFFWVKS